MVVDISGLSYFMPVYGFLFVFVIIFALLAKTKILGDNKFINLIIAFVIATVFSLMSSVQTYVQLVTPWFAVLIIVIFFILLVISMSGSKIEAIMKPGFVWVLIGALMLVFVIAAIMVFAPFNTVWGNILSFITTEAKIAGTIIFIVIAAIVAFIVAKK